MTRRTDPADARSCALVLSAIVDALNRTPAVGLLIRTKPELRHLFDAAGAALAGASMLRFSCTAHKCAWSGLFPDRFPESFVCARCGSRNGEAVR